VGRIASAFDHVHPLIETAGPTSLDMGDILTGEGVRRVGATLVGRQFDILRLANNASTSIVTPVDVDPVLSAPLKATTNYVVVWVMSYVTAALTTGLRVGMHYTGTLGSNTLFALLGATAPTAMQAMATGADDGLLGQAGVGPGATTVIEVLYALVRTSTAGVLSARFASGVNGSSVTIGTNSHMLVIQQ